MAEPKKQGFNWYKLATVILTAVLMYLGVLPMMPLGCVKINPFPVVVPPEPVVKELKKIVVVSESAQQSPAMAMLVTSLQGGVGYKWLEEKGIELVGIVDPGDINSEGQACKLVSRWQDKFSGKNQVLLLDKDGGFIGSADLPEEASLESFKSLCTVSSEPAFADMPYVDCEWSDWEQFGKGDTSEDGKFDGTTDSRDGATVLRGAEPVFGQGALAEPNPAEGEPVFEDAVPVIPRDQWPTLVKSIDDAGGGLDLLVTRIYDQKSEGSCVSNATCQAMEIAQARRRGRASVIHLSAISLYKRCGRSPGSGSMVSTNLKEILGTGVLPLDNEQNRKLFKHVMPNTGFYQKYPDGWQETAKRFRGNEVYDIRSYDGFITALLRGYPVVYGRSGHSICAVRPIYRGNQLYVKYANSWHESWGDKGYGYDSESKIRAGASWAFALRTVVDPDLN